MKRISDALFIFCLFYIWTSSHDFYSHLEHIYHGFKKVTVFFLELLTVIFSAKAIYVNFFPFWQIAWIYCAVSWPRLSTLTSQKITYAYGRNDKVEQVGFVPLWEGRNHEFIAWLINTRNSRLMNSHRDWIWAVSLSSEGPWVSDWNSLSLVLIMLLCVLNERKLSRVFATEETLIVVLVDYHYFYW